MKKWVIFKDNWIFSQVPGKKIKDSNQQRRDMLKSKIPSPRNLRKPRKPQK